MIINLIFKIVKHVQDSDLKELNSNSKETIKLKSSLHILENVISNIPMENCGKHPGGYIFSLLEKAKVGYSKWRNIVNSPKVITSFSDKQIHPRMVYFFVEKID